VGDDGTQAHLVAAGDVVTHLGEDLAVAGSLVSSLQVCSTKMYHDGPQPSHWMDRRVKEEMGCPR
jgi:hypothetical protein